MTSWRRSVFFIAVAAIAIVTLTTTVISCTSGIANEQITVVAASSLIDVLTELGEEFEQQNGVKVNFNFTSSSAAARQVSENVGSVNVFISASRFYIDQVAEFTIPDSVARFALNELVVVSSTSEVASFGDIANSDISLILAAPNVPAGRYAREVIANAETSGDFSPQFPGGFTKRVTANVVSEELNVRLALAKVALGEADAAIVYKTDGLAAIEAVRVVAIPTNVNIRTEYWLAVLKDAPELDATNAFAQFLLSDVAQEVVARHGFIP